MSRHARTNGWTPERQLAFLAALAGGLSVSAAADAAGMSRESAYRLRGRPSAALFAALWNLALAPTPFPLREGHNVMHGDGGLLRVLSNHQRRKSGDFSAVGSSRREARP